MQTGRQIAPAHGAHAPGVQAYRAPAGFALEYGFDGLQLDWSNYVPTFSKRESHWGHRWGQG